MKLSLFFINLYLFSFTNCFSQSKCITNKIYFNDRDTVKSIKSIAEFDSTGKEIRIKYFDNGRLTWVSEKKYNSENKVIQMLDYFDWSNTGHYDISITKFQYDKKGRLKKEITLKKNEKSKIKYYYRRKDTLLQKEVRSNGIKGLYFYDTSRNNVFIEYYKNGKHDYSIKYDYNERHQQVHYTTSSYPNWHNYYLYDKSGNQVEFLRFDEKGILKQKIKYYYDNLSKLIRTEEFDEEMNEPEFIYLNSYEYH